jgi:hypothetical protein
MRLAFSGSAQGEEWYDHSTHIRQPPFIIESANHSQTMCGATN